MNDCMNPAWLDVSFLVQVVRSLEDPEQGVEVVKWQCQPAVAPGGNYTSHLYRISVDYKHPSADTVKSTSIIVKAPLTSDHSRDIIRRGNLYDKERIFYNEILPRFHKFPNFQLAPKSYYCPLSRFLVLEDMRACGYATKGCDRLDLTHSLKLFFALAKLHALSVDAFRREPQLANFGSSHFLFNDQDTKEEQETRRKMCDRLLSGMANTIDKVDGCQKYAAIIRERMNSYWERMVQVLKRRGGLTVLNHGDPWTNNVFFKYDTSGDVVDVRLIDFQNYYFSSFAFDIIYYWWMSASEEVREHHREELFENYRQTLNTTLHELKCEVTLSKEEFDLEIKTCAFYSLFVFSFILVFEMADPEKVFDTTNLSDNDFSTRGFDDDAPPSKQSAVEYWKTVIPSVLLELEEMGAFD